MVDKGQINFDWTLFCLVLPSVDNNDFCLAQHSLSGVENLTHVYVGLEPSVSSNRRAESRTDPR